jgi:hypothetical protein
MSFELSRNYHLGPEIMALFAAIAAFLWLFGLSSLRLQPIFTHRELSVAKPGRPE